MIVRKYGRRGRGSPDSFSDVVSDSPSQECHQDVYDFAFSPRDSSHCNWSDPYSFGSSQESRPLTRDKSRDFGDFDGGRCNPKKLKVIDVDSEPFTTNSSQETNGFGFLTSSGGGFDKVKKVDSDPYEYKSSPELEEISVLPVRKVGKNSGNFEFSEDGDVWKSSKFKNDPYGLNSSRNGGELRKSQPRKLGGWGLEGISRISKKNEKKGVKFGGGLDESSSKVKKVDFDSYGYNSSQELDEISILPTRKVGESSSNFEFSEVGDVWKSSKFKNDPYGLNSSQDGGGLRTSQPRKLGGWGFEGISRISKKNEKKKEVKFGGVLDKSSKVKNVDSDPYGYNSSQELDEFSTLPKRKVGESSSNFEFSEDGDVWKPSKFKNDPYGLNSSQDLGEVRISQPRKSGCLEFDGVPRKSKKNDKKEHDVLHKKRKKNKNKMKPKDLGPENAVITTTLMETQEYGEMMEHVDEVNFALDGLKKGQQIRIRRASLLSLLSICGTAQQRRLLRVHGMAKTIIDAVLGLSFDDQESNLAAAALFYILTSDGQDDHLLDSPNCVRFLIKLLKPFTSTAASEKVPTIGSKLLSMCKNAGFSQDSAKGIDSSSSAIKLRVQEILVNCKEMKPRDDHDYRMEDPKMIPKWISLLTMEKACLSTLPIEDTYGTVKRPRGHFKEKLRELGGLDAVFEVARKCHSTMEEWLEKSPTFSLDLGDDDLKLESLLVVLKCLKVMENATFLSKDNQCHLLGMKGKFDGQRASRSFTKLILSVIKILSGVSLLGSSRDEKLGGTSNGSSYSGGFCSMECSASQKSFDLSQCNQGLFSSHTGLEPSQVSAYPDLLKMRLESSAAGSCSGTFENLDVIHISSDNAELESVEKRQLLCTKAGATEYSQDPFAFDDDGFEPSKWDVLSGNVMKPLPQVSRPTVSECRDENHSVLGLSQQESSNVENHQSHATSCPSTVDEEKSSLLADCLLTAVKVLMNLTNDNSEGCHQVAACGGLEILSSLIAGHFPSFSSSLPPFLDVRESSLSPKSSTGIDRQKNTQLTDQELDFLVAILGLLVNLVEKDGHNRSRLAAATVSVPSVIGFGLEDDRGVIPLLCSIFLANQGAGEAAGDGNNFSWEDEESILQGEKEAEKMIVEAYAALLLAFLSTERKSIRDTIADSLPNQNLTILVPVLERFVEFHMTLNVISPETHKAVLEVIESCRIP